MEPRDRYGRLLAYLWLADGTLFNELLLGEGYAQLLTIPPNNVKYGQGGPSRDPGGRAGAVGGDHGRPPGRW